MKTAVVSEKPGGTIVLTNDVSNYPGFKQIDGLGLAKSIEEHAKEYDVEFIDKKVLRVEKIAGGFKVVTKDGELNSKTIIFATGTEWRKMNVPGEKEFTGKGVHYCALCDGAVYRDKVIGVVGGGNSATKEALLLAEYGKKVYIIYRGEEVKAEAVILKRIEDNEKIEVINNTNVVEIRGGKFVNKVIFDAPYNGSKEFDLDALFVDIGHVPISDLARNLGIELNKKGEIKIDREAKTNLGGVFAAGDVADNKFKQAITGVAEGVTAAYSAHEYINK